LPAKKGGNEMTKEMITKRIEELYWERAEVREGGRKPIVIYPKRDIWLDNYVIEDYQVEWFVANSYALRNIEDIDEIEEDDIYLIRVDRNRDTEEKSQNWLVITFWDLKK